MKTDLYTKAVLTVIALLLGVIAFNQFAKPIPVAAAAQGRATFSSDASLGTPFAVDSAGNVFLYQNGHRNILMFRHDGAKVRQFQLHLGSPE